MLKTIQQQKNLPKTNELLAHNKQKIKNYYNLPKWFYYNKIQINNTIQVERNQI